MSGGVAEVTGEIPSPRADPVGRPAGGGNPCRFDGGRWKNGDGFDTGQVVG